MCKKLNLVVCVALMVACVGLSEATTVGWDGTSTDITDLTANGGSKVGLTGIWSTSTAGSVAIGSQTAWKAVIGNPRGPQVAIEVNIGYDCAFVGGSSSPTSTSPYTTMTAFDTGVFGAAEVLGTVSMTLRNRQNDTAEIRWFVEADGSTYVSGVVTTATNSFQTITISDATAIEWFNFDDTLEIGPDGETDPIGTSAGTLSLTNVDYVGIHSDWAVTVSSPVWAGGLIRDFVASTPIDPVPIADAGLSYVTWLDNGTLALAGTVDDRGEGDVINTDVVWSIKTSPPSSNPTLSKTSTDWANPTANFTPDLSVAGDYTIELTVTDAAAQPGSDTLLVQVAADACEATQLADELSIYDVNENCIIDLSDMAAFAAKWMSDMSWTGPFAY